MKQLFETIAHAEMLGFAFLVIAAMVIAVAVIFFFTLIIILDKKNIPVIRPLREPETMKKHLLDIKSNLTAHKNNIMSLDEGKDLKNGGPFDIAMVILKNYGNSSAIDIQITHFGDYVVSEDYSNKFVSLAADESAAFLFYIPKELLNSVKVSVIKVKSKNFSNSTRTDKFSVISDSDIAYEISSKYTIHPFIQI